jgi:uncharacterized protein YcfJ
MFKRIITPAMFIVLAGSLLPIAAQDLPVPPGTRMVIELQTGISTESSRVGDPFTATVMSPASYEGSIVRGHIADMEESGRLKGKTTMALAFDSIETPGGRVEPMRAELMELRQSESVKVVDEEGNIQSGSRGEQAIKRTAIGAAIGGALGGLIGGGKGALIGILVGGGAGAGSLVVEGEKELRLESGAEMEIRTLSERAGTVTDLPRSDYTMDRETIREVQTALNERGYDVGTPDGALGSRTRSALRRFQRENNLPITGRVDRNTAEALGVRW